MDVLFELPLLIGIVTTGALLLRARGSLDAALLVKIGAAIVALAFNVVCVVFVLQRRHAVDERLARLTARIRYTGIGVPFGVVALVLGLLRFHAP